MVDFHDIITRLHHPDYVFELTWEAGRAFLHVACRNGVDNRTGEPMAWKGRKWRLSHHMTAGEVVQTAFLAVMTAVEHETREQFTYKGVTVFDPHYDIEALVALRRSMGAVKERIPSDAQAEPVSLA